MNLLIDTNALLWWLAGSDRLSVNARQAISEADTVWVSAASGWEIGWKVALGKLDFGGDLEEQIRLNAFRPLPITLAHAVHSTRLPILHRDPFDRLLVAQAMLESLTLLTSDRQLAAYGVPVLLT